MIDHEVTDCRSGGVEELWLSIGESYAPKHIYFGDRSFPRGYRMDWRECMEIEWDAKELKNKLHWHDFVFVIENDLQLAHVMRVVGKLIPASYSKRDDRGAVVSIYDAVTKQLLTWFDGKSYYENNVSNGVTPAWTMNYREIA